MSRVVIVGGGPAGCSTAISILKNDPSAEVTLIDKKVRKRPCRCAGGVSCYMLEKIGLRIPDYLIGARIRTVRIHSPNGNFWELSAKEMGVEEYGYVLSRDIFDGWLISQAEKLGARLVERNVNPLHLVRGVFYDVLVGADGFPSKVANLVGRPNPPSQDLHLGVQRTVLWTEYPQNLINLFFGNEVAPLGYAWIFPCGDGRARVGLGIPLSLGLNAKQFLDEFTSRIGGYEGELIAKIIPTARPPRTSVYGNTLLVGDAGLWCDPLTGGGIANAVLSGYYAGKAIAEGNLKKYDVYMRQLYMRNLFRYFLKQLLYSMTDDDFNKLIQLMRGFKPKTLSISRELARVLSRLALRGLFIKKFPWIIRKAFKLERVTLNSQKQFGAHS